MVRVLENPFDAIRREIAEEYAAEHDKPWIIGFSGGKDSTLVTHLVVEHLLDLPRSERVRPVHIVANDTLVESPLVIAHIKAIQDELRNAAAAFSLPLVVGTTEPDPDHTFWVNLIGRGYPSPNRSFRWCTDRLSGAPYYNINVTCLDGLDMDELMAAPVTYRDGRNNDWGAVPAEVRHL